MKAKRAIVLFDEDCNLCNAAATFIKRWDRTEEIELIPQQSNEGVQLLNHHSIVGINSIAFINNEMVFLESDAVVEVSKLLHFPWNLVRICAFVPKKLRDRIYGWIARNRYKWFGKKSCQSNCQY